MRTITAGFFLAICAAACGAKPAKPRDDANLWQNSKDSKFKLQLKWTSGPVANDYSSALLSFELPDQTKVESVEITGFDPQMPTMGHGTETEDQEFMPVADRPDQAEVKGIYFIMGGPWVIYIDAKVNDITDRVEVGVRVP